MSADPLPIDIAAYCDRIAYTGRRAATVEVLHALHLAHATHIPFENLDILLGRPIRLDLPRLEAKLVHGQRGGYCFEQNTLFAAILEAFGFPVTRLAARVRYRTQRVLPRTHMVLQVEAQGRPWLADVGFGADGLLLPVPMEDAAECTQFAWRYRLTAQQGTWVLQSWRDDGWQDLYAFTLEPQLPVDYEVANYYVSTHRDSRFTQTLTAQRSWPGRRLTLRNLDLVSDDGNQETRVTLSRDDLLGVLHEQFGLIFPPGTHFPIPVLDEPGQHPIS